MPPDQGFMANSEACLKAKRLSANLIAFSRFSEHSSAQLMELLVRNGRLPVVSQHSGASTPSKPDYVGATVTMLSDTARLQAVGCETRLQPANGGTKLLSRACSLLRLPLIIGLVQKDT
jgi:hypothetical protein